MEQLMASHGDGGKNSDTCEHRRDVVHLPYAEVELATERDQGREELQKGRYRQQRRPRGGVQLDGVMYTLGINTKAWWLRTLIHGMRGNGLAVNLSRDKAE